MSDIKHKNIVLAVMCLCVTLIIATVATINISIPKIEASNLHPSGAQLLWIVDLYVVVFAGLLFPSGAIGGSGFILVVPEQTAREPAG